jgi:hypothetical protein
MATLDPFSLSASIRAFVYNSIVLKFETGEVRINQKKFNKKELNDFFGFEILSMRKLTEVQNATAGKKISGEFLIFYVEGKGYECLFKRLRDTFAHGHFEKGKRGWLTLCHQYRGENNKKEQVRLYGQISYSSLKKMVNFLDLSNSENFPVE